MVCAVGDEKGNIFDQISITTKTPGETIPQVTAYFKKEKVEALGVGCFGPVDLNQIPMDALQARPSWHGRILIWRAHWKEPLAAPLVLIRM